ncbi:hypothetical protein CLV97_11443 [Planifilum fimeticola]|jgi:hypothetical protein|uniref:GAF domain-containing protein n=1 Tax=Planifilum fimeticola TaxID=201975 RepID=A0A2T0LE31_9BACL|nr:hypothetical protein [Planifilum fimeticola]PRX40355.1 hypothetical protein CLV97_11443 [Planifilum fimeticola]
MPSWDQYIIGSLDEFSWMKYVILGFALVLVFAAIAICYRVFTGKWIPYGFQTPEKKGMDKTTGSDVEISSLPAEMEFATEVAPGLHPLKDYMNEKDRKIDTLKRILQDIERDMKKEADRNNNFIAVLEILADGVSTALTRSYNKSGDAFEIDYPYVIDSIQSAMANEIAVHPGVAVFIVDPEDQGRLLPYQMIGFGSSFRNYRPSLTVKSPEGWVWLNESTKYWDKLLDSEVPFTELPPQTRSMIASPIFANEEKLGILTVNADVTGAFEHPLDPRYVAAFAKVFSSLLYIDRKLSQGSFEEGKHG